MAEEWEVGGLESSGWGNGGEMKSILASYCGACPQTSEQPLGL
jgi:hypothetical protein